MSTESEAPPPILADGSSPGDAASLLGRLDELGIECRTVTHGPVYTVEQAKEARGELPGAHTKNLFVRDKKGAMWLIVALEDRQIDLKSIAAALGHKRFSFGSQDRLMKYLGVIPGAVTPFAVVNDHGGQVRVALDSGLLSSDFWSFHPLDNSMTTTLRPADMLSFLEAVDHPPTWLDLGDLSSDPLL